jgi:hypothetical protein
LSIDPGAPSPRNPDAAVAQRLAGLERRLAALERRQSQVTVGAGAPAGVAPDNAFYVDRVGLRLYIGVAGTWRSASLT